MNSVKLRLFSGLTALALVAQPWAGVRASVVGDDTPSPEKVNIPGTHQSELGCTGDWQPDCDKTFLTYDAEDDVWQGSFEIAPASDQDNNGARYKFALNGGWDENYGQNAKRGGSDIPLSVSEPTAVKFYYDHKTHWGTDSVNSPIAVAVGDFQKALGCAQDNAPDCLRAWLQDPEGTGTLSFVTTALPAGDYALQIALNERTEEIYGQDGQAAGDPIPFTVKATGDEIYIAFTPATKEIVVSTEGAPRGSLEKAQAHWVAQDTIAWKVKNGTGYTYQLYAAPNGGLALTPTGLTGGTALPLKYNLGGLSSRIILQYPHLGGYGALQLAAPDLAQVPELLKGQVAVAAFDENGKLVDATSLQIPGVLDDLYDYTGALGVEYTGDTPTLRVWAPTAQAVALLLFDDATTPASTSYPMTLDPATGVWSVEGKADWTFKYYLYEVQVYVPSVGAVVTNQVTDPYSFSLSTNSLRSQVVNLADPALMPAGWETLAKPPLAAPEDSVIYELHIRDFSNNDPTVPEELRGTYRAFTVADSNGMQHLAALAQAGLTHIHLLPAFDIASVNEDKSTWQTVDTGELSQLPPDSDAQALAVSNVAGSDAFNWGYDPYHYSAPEGSYATDPEGAARILEFREMVQALNGTGLRVVMDVVYNHTNSSGQSDKSVLDKIVPGYYHRLNAEGSVEHSTCCENTATEHKMMEKLMIDSVVLWATAYKVDGFRFDLMGHHMLSNMTRLRATLDALTPETAGVNGQAVYVYGEGWNFGEVANNARGTNATQLNIGGSGIGVFNDRLRDAVRGGGPFDDPRLQGFATGLLDEPNANEQSDEKLRTTKLLQYMDWLRVGLAGNLKDYQFINTAGKLTSGSKINYNGAPAGYTLDPQENIIYVSAHDNETLFDAIQLKAASSATITDRVRMNNLALSVVMFAQGVPFFHAGDDILRSKSLDRNTYNSGDWFNRIDWSYQTNNWGVGLPIEGKENWEIFRPLLADPTLQAQPADIALARDVFRELLQIRRSSPLFRLQTVAEVQQRLAFHNTGPDQTPGLIVMSLDDRMGTDLDPEAGLLVVLFNGNKDRITFTNAAFQGLALELHPVQQTSVDAVVKTATFDSLAGTFTIPGRTAAVFVLKQTAPAPTATAQPTAQPTVAPTAQPTVEAEPTSNPQPTALPVETLTPMPPISAVPANTAGGIAIAFGLAMIAMLLGMAIWMEQKGK